MTRASAPGKVILLGEHAVVYGQPALAVPVTQVQAQATVVGTAPPGRGCEIELPDVARWYSLAGAPAHDPVAAAVRLTCLHAGLDAPPSVTVRVESSIPIASGLGSGAAVCTAVVRALASHIGYALNDAEVSALVFETEKLLHGTPSGIDNTVVAYGRPVFFIKGQPPEPLTVLAPFQLLIGDTGIASPTKVAVDDVRALRQQEPERFDQIFASIGALVNRARAILEQGERALTSLGELMNQNHSWLREIGVSSPELEALVTAARAAGAAGAKLSGAGRGGNMLALVVPENEPAVRAALERAGARRVLETHVGR